MAKVTVGLKLAGNLIISVDGKDVELNGHSKNIIYVENGHGITENVDKDFWDKWLQENKESKLVKNGFIFAHDSTKSVKDEAKDKKANKSGTEKLKQGEGVETAPKKSE